MDSPVILFFKISFYNRRRNSATNSSRNGRNFREFPKGSIRIAREFIFIKEILVFEGEFSIKSPKPGGDFENSRGQHAMPEA